MSWATPAEALGITGESVTQAKLDQAYQVVELYTGVTTDALSNLRPRDLRLLKQAEAYQAAWLARQVDYLGRSDFDLVSQDGLQYSKGDRDAHELAPLAKAAISRLSWRRSRTVVPLTPEQALALRGVRTPRTIGIHDTSEGGDIDDDGLGQWRPL